MRLLNSALASTSSGLYLVSQTHLTAAQASKLAASPVLEKPPPLPEPDWSLLETLDNNRYQTQEELKQHIDTLTTSLRYARHQIHARNLVIEGNQAQLVVQGMAIKKMKESVEARVKSKTTERSTLFPGGHALVLTNTEFIQKVEEHRRSKLDEEEGRNQRCTVRAGKQVEKVKIEDEWQQVKEAHEKAVDTWAARCAQLTLSGTLKKDLPKCPKCPLKPKPAPVATSS
ncbi:hypothetical protein F5148DRAFT_1152090 [Russula earlei]|uniref:Uncharacterized protein n=1 Tax=Russula earlei TaxID=71964 RepID=A0ACC0TYV9_9AGAM|nr:hypothetical protein F5148DRAFT_1152090 [Russula earlei]